MHFSRINNIISVRVFSIITAGKPIIEYKFTELVSGVLKPIKTILMLRSATIITLYLYDVRTKGTI